MVRILRHGVIHSRVVKRSGRKSAFLSERLQIALRRHFLVEGDHRTLNTCVSVENELEGGRVHVFDVTVLYGNGPPYTTFDLRYRVTFHDESCKAECSCADYVARRQARGKDHPHHYTVDLTSANRRVPQTHIVYEYIPDRGFPNGRFVDAPKSEAA